MTIIAFGHYVLTDDNEMAWVSHLSMRSRGTGSDLGGTRDHTQTCQPSFATFATFYKKQLTF